MFERIQRTPSMEVRIIETAFREQALWGQRANVAMSSLAESLEKLRAAFGLYTRAELKQILRTGTKAQRKRAYALLVRQRVHC